MSKWLVEKIKFDSKLFPDDKRFT